MTAFIDDHRDRFGVEPICRVLTGHGCKIAPSTYYAAKSRPLSARAQRDAVVLGHIRRVHGDPRIGRGLYGARKVWHELRREQARGEHRELGSVPRCQIERLMRANNIRGTRRDKGLVTTRSQRAAARPADLAKRNFTASRPNELWVVDFTYVPTWSHMAFSAFVSDVYSRRIVGWRTAAAMPTQLPLDAPADGAVDPPTGRRARRRTHPPQRRRQPIHLNPLHQPARRRRRARLNRHCRRQLRQRHGRIGDRALQDRMRST